MSKESDLKEYSKDEKAMFNIAEKARDHATSLLVEYRIPERLGLAIKEDIYLAINYFAIRLLRSNVYNSSRFLGMPGMSKIASLPGVGKFVHNVDYRDRRSREAIEFIEEVNEDIIGNNYQEENVRLHPRQIELAINDLLARSTIQTEAGSKLGMSQLGVREWASNWRDKLSISETPGQ